MGAAAERVLPSLLSFLFQLLLGAYVLCLWFWTRYAPYSIIVFRRLTIYIFVARAFYHCLPKVDHIHIRRAGRVRAFHPAHNEALVLFLASFTAIFPIFIVGFYVYKYCGVVVLCGGFALGNQLRCGPMKLLVY